MDWRPTNNFLWGTNTFRCLIVQTFSKLQPDLDLLHRCAKCTLPKTIVFDFQETALVFVKEGDFEQLTQLLSPVEFSRLKPLVLLLGWPYCYSCENASNLLEALWNPSVSFN